MPRILDREHVEPALGAMLGCCDVDGGPTDEQRALITALAIAYFHDEKPLDEIAQLGPDDVASVFTTPDERRRVSQLLMVVELCRHPLTKEQEARTEAYADALGTDPEFLAIARDMVGDGFDTAEADFRRTFGALEPGLREPSLAGEAGSAPLGKDDALVARLQSFHDCPEGSLGRAYIEFYDRWGFPLPGAEDQPAAVFVAHDMSHVIAGYDPVGIGEIALGMMQLGVRDCDEHWIQLLGNLGVHEAGYIQNLGSLANLAKPGAAEIVAEAFDRGARCTKDFTLIDHLGLVDEQLEDVRADYGIPPLTSTI